MEREHLIKPLLDRRYPKIHHGKGIYLYDEDGKAYLDACSGAVTAGIGHGVPEVLEAMKEQADKVSFVYRSQFTSEPAEQLAKRLSDSAPGGGYWTFFANSGSEATETAMKIAIQHWQERGKTGKTIVLSRRMSYHGITLGALSMSGHAARRRRFVPLLEEWPMVPAPYCYRCPLRLTHPECALACADELEAAIRRLGAEHVAAFIAEPVIGAAGGAVVPPEGYFQKVMDICDRHDVLLIADEVMTGIGRTGAMFAMEHWGVEPDLIALGKGMTAGYTPMAAAMAKDAVIEPILNGSKSVMSGHTFSANPLSAAVSLAVLDYVEQHGLVQAAAEKGAYLSERLRAMADRCEIIGDVRGKGLLWGLEFVSDRAAKRPFPAERNVTARIVDRAFGKGLLVYPASGGDDRGGDAIILAPPYTVTLDELDQAVSLLEESIRETAEEVRA